MLDKGYTGYLAKIMDTTKKTKVQPTDVRVMSTFVDVFSIDLLGLPLNHEIEFEIEILSKMTLISKTPYLMAPTQLQELFDKNFIHPSYSPWGTLILFVKKKDKSM